MPDFLWSIIKTFLLENMDGLKAQLITWAREAAKRTDTPWDDQAVDVLASLLGVEG